MCMPMALSSSTGVTSSEVTESTDIESEQAQQESASILNVLRAMRQQIFVESEEWNSVFDYSYFDSCTICPLANR